MRVTKTNPGSVAPPMGTYSHAVRVETEGATWIHVSGQVSLAPDGAFVGPGDMRAQTEQVFENLKAILEAEGASFDHVVKVSTFVTSLDDLAGMREVRSRYVPSEPPASTSVQVVALFHPEAMIEVDVVAVLPS